MAIELNNNAVFLHIPKTGGTWVENALLELGLVRDTFGNRHSDYVRTLNEERFRPPQVHFRRALTRKIKTTLGARPPEPRPWRFCFVRNPLTWYESWWRYMQERSWKHWGVEDSTRDWHPNAVLNGLGNEDFNTFVRKVVAKRPGYVTELYFSFAFPTIDFVGRMENLAADFVLAMQQIDAGVDEARVLGMSKKNESAKKPGDIAWDPGLRDTVIKLELPSLVAFGYLGDSTREKLGLDRSAGAMQSLSATPLPAGRQVELTQ